MTAAMKKARSRAASECPDRAVDPVEPSLLARRCLLEPLVVSGLLGCGSGLDRLERAEEFDSPGIEVVAEGAGSHPVLLVHRSARSR